MDTTTSLAPATVLTAAAVDALPAEPLGHLPDVAVRTLWEDGTSTAGVLRIGAGRRLGMHAHRVNHHHIWVLDGEAVILGTTVGAGSYVHVPSGVDHDIDATSTDGCTVFYLYAGYGS